MRIYSLDYFRQFDRALLTKNITSFTVCAVSFVIGVCATLVLKNLIDITILLMLLLSCSLFVRRQVLVLPVFILLLGFSWANYVFTVHFESQLPSEYEGVTIVLTGEVDGLPAKNAQSSRFNFKINQAKTISNETIAELSNHKVVLSCYHCYMDFLPEQEWSLSVRLKRPHSYASWGAFDYEKYLFRNRIIATGYIRIKDQNELINSKSGFSITQLRYQIRSLLNQTLSDKNNAKSIIAALMIGDKSHFSNQQQLTFQKTGISHLMAISGLHIGLAFMVTIWLLKWVLFPVAQLFNWVPRQKLVLIPALFVALSYSALAGFAISTQRALIMLCLFVLARFCARELSLLKVLLMTVVVIFVVDPLSILDVGFWLSCSAVLVIGLAAQYQNLKKIQDSELHNNLSLIKLQPLLWIGMLPVTLLFFGKISLLSPIINLLMVPLFCGVLIPITLFALVLYLIGLNQLSNSLLSVLSYCYQQVYWVLETISEWPIAQVSLTPMRIIDWLLFVLVILAYYKKWRLKHILALLFVIVFFVFNNPRNLEADEYIVTLLDVGQGLSMVIEAPDYVLVYDTGPAYSSGFSTAQSVLIPYLQRRGIRQIDMLIISHADNDHIGGLKTLTEAIEIKQILTSRVDKIPGATNCQKGQIWSVEGIDFEIISPDEGTPQGSNNRSCVLIVSNGFKKTLISGDIERQVERYLVNNESDISADILLVPHQGSKTSSTATFIDVVKPDLALIAAGYRNHYGHPHNDVVSRYKNRNINIASTIDSGSILLKINKKDVNIKSYRRSNKGFWNHVKKAT